MITGIPALFASRMAGFSASVSAGEIAITSTSFEMKSSTIATWSANATCVAGERLRIFTLNPFLFASAAPFSKKSVAVLKTPVMSGGVQPITISV